MGPYLPSSGKEGRREKERKERRKEERKEREEGGKEFSALKQGSATSLTC